MALNAVVLATALQPTLKTAFVAVGAVDNPALETFMAALATAIASAVVTHITGNAVVTPTLLVAPPSGGPVTGTGAVT